MLAGRVVGDHGLGAALDQEEPQPVAVIGPIGGTQPSGRQRFEQRLGERRITTLAWAYLEREGTAATVDNSMDFCRSPATRAADRLELGPPFPPAAERCALAVVLSII